MVYENPDGVRIGLEIHVQLNKLKTKMFCGCSTDYHNDAPNTHTCPVCLGLPGSLPVLNKKAVEAAIKVGLALEGEIAEETQFHRKNYFYPDLPKGYQITQYDYPIVSHGKVIIEGEDGEHVVGITRAHMEEDPGKLVHIGSIEKSKGVLIDYNRSGMPLIETVTEPDMRSPKEARRFLDKFRNILEYLDVFDGNLEGAMRVDANVSVHWGTRVEIKNISSHKGVERALLYEIMRQKNVIRRGGKITQETRHFDEGRGVTISMRTKEEAEDYRYFREPDLMPMRVTDWIPEIKETLPELPDAKRTRFMEQYGITDMHARALTSSILLADFYEAVCAERVDPKIAATWIADVLLGEQNYRDYAIFSFDGKKIGFVNNKDPSITNSFKVTEMVELITLFTNGKINDRSAVEIIRKILYDEEKKYIPQEIIVEDFHRRVFNIVKDLSATSSIVSALMTELKNQGIQLHANVEGTIKGYQKDQDKTVSFTDKNIAELSEMVTNGRICEKSAAEIIRTYIESKKDSKKSPEEIAEEKGLFKAEDDLVTKAVAEAIAENAAAVQDYLGGTEKSLNFLVGQVMKKTKGTADAKTARELIVKELKG